MFQSITSDMFQSIRIRIKSTDNKRKIIGNIDRQWPKRNMNMGRQWSKGDGEIR